LDGCEVATKRMTVDGTAAVAKQFITSNLVETIEKVL
jgi:hypothetical protein